MKDNGIIHRLSIYTNYGAAGFCITLLMLFVLKDSVMLLLPVAFNTILSKRLVKGTMPEKLIPALLIGLLTTSVFLIQYQYRRQVDWSCIKLISDEKAFVSYAFNLIFFSVIMWETAVLLKSRISFGQRSLD